MTEYIEIARAHEDIREGDRVTFTRDTHLDMGEVIGHAYSGKTIPGLYVAGFPLQGSNIVKVERPKPEVPTGAGAVIRKWDGFRDMYYVLAHPESTNYRWRSHGAGDFLASDMARILAEGGQVLFHGVEE